MFSYAHIGESADLKILPPSFSRSAAWRGLIQGNHLVRNGQLTTESKPDSSPYLFEIHEQLKRFSAFRGLLQRAKVEPAAHRHWCWRTLFKDASASLGILTVYHERPIPIHNYSDKDGVYLLLDGEMESNKYQYCSNYEIESKHQSDLDKNVVNLKQVQSTRLQPNDVVRIGVEDDLLHGLSSVSDRCILLVVQFAEPRLSTRSWYIPLPGSLLGNCILAKSVRNRCM